MDDILYLAGHIPIDENGRPVYTGKVGREIDLDSAYQAARLVGVNLLGTLKDNIGSLDKVRRIAKVTGMVNVAEGFSEIPQVINGFSDLMGEVFGDDVGRHARAAVGVAELPLSVPVEIEMVVHTN